MRRTLPLLVALVVLSGLGVTLALWQSGWVESWMRGALRGELSRRLGHEVRFSRIGGDPWRGMVFHDVRIERGPAATETPLASAARVLVEFDVNALLHDLWSGTRTAIPAIRRVALEDADIDLVRNASGRWNVESLFAPPPPGAPPGPVLRAVIELRGGRIGLTDEDRALAVPFRADFSALTARVDTVADPVFRFRATAAGSGLAGVRASGWLDMRSGALDLDVDARGGAIARWAPYLLRDRSIRWEGGRADALLHVYTISVYGPRAPDVAGTAHVREAALRDAGTGARLTRVFGRVELRAGALRLHDVAFAYGGAPGRVSGEVVLGAEPRVDLSLRGRNLDLAALRALVAPAAPAVRGRVTGAVRVQGTPGHLRAEGDLAAPVAAVGAMTVRDVRTEFRYEAQTLSLTDARLTVDGGGVGGDAVVTAGDAPRFLAVLQLADVPASAASRIGVSLPVTARVTGTIAASGGGSDVRLMGFLRAPAARAFGWDVSAPRLGFSYANGGIAIDYFRARHGTVDLAAWGSIQADGQLGLRVLARNAELEPLAARLGLDVPVGGRASAVVSLTGSFMEPAVTGTLIAADGRIASFHYDDALAEFRATRRTLRLARASVRDGDDLYRIEGDASWGAFGALSLTVSTEGVRVARLVEIAGLPATAAGVASGTVRIGGTAAAPAAEASLSWRDGRTAGQSFDRLEGDVAWRDGVLDVRRAVVRRGDSSAEARGRVGTDGRLSLDFEATRLRLDDIALLRNPSLTLRGEVAMRGRAEGTVSAPELTASVRSEDLAVNGQRFDLAEGVVRWRGETVTLDPVTLSRGGSRYTARGTLRFAGEPVAELEAELRGASIRTLLRLARNPFDADGVIDGTLRLSGPLSNPRAEMDVAVRDATVSRVPFRSARGRFSLSNRRVEIQRLEAFPSEGRLAAVGFVNLDGRSEVEVSGENLLVDLLRAPLRFRQPLLGRFGFTLQLFGTLQDPRAGLTFEMTRAGPEGAVVDRILGEAFYRDGELTVEQVLIERSGQRLRVEGELPADLANLRVDPGKPLSLRVVADQTDLSVLRLFAPAVEEAQGRIAGSVEVSGTSENLQLEGGFTVTDGRIKMYGVNTPLEGLRLQLAFRENRARLTQFEGRLGAGRLSASGDLVFRDFEPDVVEVAIHLVNAGLDVPGMYRGQVDGTLTLSGSASRPAASGRLVLSAGEIMASLAPARPTAAPLPPLALNLEIAAGPGLFANAGPLRVALQGSLRLGGTLAKPTLSGTIVGTGGQYRAFGIPFELEQATGTFQEFRGLEPLITARARARINDVTIYANIRGTPGELSLVLSSEPSLPQERIVQLLAGQTGFAGQPNTGAITALVAQELSRLILGDIETRLRDLFGLTEFGIDYSFDRPLQLRVGRYVADQLHFTVTSTFGEQTTVAWALEYRFAPSYALVLGSDRRSPWFVLVRAAFEW